LKTVVQGQQAENLLDFDEPTDPSAGGTGLASIIMGGGASSNPATAKILTSSNPLDDLVSIFGNANINASAPTSVPGSGSIGMMEGLGGISHNAPVAQAQPTIPQNDLLDLF
jgi:AP-1 complex subunit beta-1